MSRRIILTGAGRGFCAVADMRDTLDAESRRREQSGQIDRGDEPDWVMLVRRSKPVVAAVNGAAIGMGCTMTLCCDTIIASHARETEVFEECAASQEHKAAIASLLARG